jgi:hypothetical protein
VSREGVFVLGGGRRPSTAAGERPTKAPRGDGCLRGHGARLVGEVVEYEDQYRLCYVRGPEGIVVALAEQRSPRVS